MAVEYSWWWWPLPPWFSPGAAWFIFFNVVVGAIAVSSRGQGGHAPSRRKLTRSASSMVLERQQSVTIFSMHLAADYGSSITATPPPPQHHHIQECYPSHTSRQVQEAAEQRQVSGAAPEPESTAGEDRTTSMTTPSAPVAAAAAAAATATAVSTSENEVAEVEEKSVSSDEAHALHALAGRDPADQPPASAAAVPAAAAVAGKVRPRNKGTKVAKWRCRWEAEEVEGKAEVNARAELFIRQFREELKLQRINSILNYKNALCPGAGAALGR